MHGHEVEKNRRDKSTNGSVAKGHALFVAIHCGVEYLCIVKIQTTREVMAMSNVPGLTAGGRAAATNLCRTPIRLDDGVNGVANDPQYA